MIAAAEKFLVDCISKDSKVQTFDELRFQTYHRKNFQLDFEKLPCTSRRIRRHIKRAYLQTFRWINAASMESTDLNPVDYAYSLDDNEHLVPDVVDGDRIPSDFPLPCNCLKCAKSTVCPCRVKQIACCKLCKYGATVDCKNPLK